MSFKIETEMKQMFEAHERMDAEAEFQYLGEIIIKDCSSRTVPCFDTMRGKQLDDLIK